MRPKMGGSLRSKMGGAVDPPFMLFMTNCFPTTSSKAKNQK
uniref:Uncharacterized protein n=1 Tax=Anguilla anguilla TaxID=7936 RepID=A0A0E9Y0H6_ANGAN